MTIEQGLKFDKMLRQVAEMQEQQLQMIQVLLEIRELVKAQETLDTSKPEQVASAR